MREHIDQDGNIWDGPFTKRQLQNRTGKFFIHVWFKNAPGCGWDTPHYMHKVRLTSLFSDFPNVARGIYVLRNKYILPTPIWSAIILGSCGIIAAAIGLFGNSGGTPLGGNHSVIDGNENIVVQGEKNTVILSNDTWEWEDLRGEVEGDFVKIRVAFKIITDQFRWKIGSHEYLDNGRKMTEELPKYLNSLPDFENALGLVAVGMASQENYKNIAVEEDRAERRADNILLALNPHQLAREKEIYKLNLGIHEEEDKSLTKDETSYQRKIIIIGVMNKSKDISFPKFEECLREALELSGGLSFDKNRYSTFDLKTYQIDYRRIEY